MDSWLGCGRGKARPSFRVAAARAASGWPPEASIGRPGCLVLEPPSMKAASSPSPRAPEGLPRSLRMTRRREFTDAYERGRKVFARYAVVFAIPNDRSYARIGVTTTRKVGKAVARNRMKRWVREVFRLDRAALHLDDKGVDIVVNVRRDALEAPWPEFRRDLDRAMRRAIDRLSSKPGRGE